VTPHARLISLGILVAIGCGGDNGAGNGKGDNSKGSNDGTPTAGAAPLAG
jgi:hypothetical protein